MIRKFNGDLGSIDDSLNQLINLLDETCNLMITGRENQKPLLKDEIKADDLTTIVLNLDYTKLMLRMIQRQHYNQLLCQYNHHLGGHFSPMAPIDSATEFIRFGVQQGLWKLGDGVTL